MKVKELTEWLENKYPAKAAEHWDNVGLLVGDDEAEVSHIFLALDLTEETLEEAIQAGADMIITHHPMIFGGIKKINNHDFTGRKIMRLIRNNISYYAMHTNFDVMGMADAAADELKLQNREVLDITFEDDIAKEGFGRLGDLPYPMTVDECAAYVKERFHLQAVKVFGQGSQQLVRAAISPGSGKSMIAPALGKGADVLITGDIDHHEGIDAVEQGMAVIDAGHYGLEKIFVPYLQEYLKRETEGIEIITQGKADPFRIL